MSLTIEQIRHIAMLARIEVTASEAERTREELNRILALIEQMQAVDTKGVEPMAHALDVVQPLREDRVAEPDQRAALLAVAPEVESGLYLVPKVIE